jgi:hypothetical protein
MQTNTWAPALTIGIVGTVIVGILTREWQPLVIGTFIVGVVGGLVGTGWRRAVPLGVGIALAFPALVAIQFGTPIGTFVNTEDAGELAGYLPLIVIIWAAVVGAGVAGLGASTLGRRFFGRSAET